MRNVLTVLAILVALLAGILALEPAMAQGGITWTTQFFNNAILQGPATVTRQDSTIGFNWGAGSPAPGVNADQFSVRWGADIFLPAGTYRFWALADDNVRIIVDFQFNPIIDTYTRPAVGQTVSADIALSAGMHHIQVDYTELTGNAYVYVAFADLATNPTGPNFPAPAPPPVVTSGSWTAEYFANRDLSGFPTLIQSEASPSHNWGSGSPVVSIPADSFSARWTSIQNLAPGIYHFSVLADDGVRVSVDGVYIINEWHSASGVRYEMDVSLTAGQHCFVVEFYEASGLAFLDYTFFPSGGPGPTPAPTPAPTIGNWLGAYYDNTTLTGAPEVTLIETSPSHNWGGGAPFSGMPADNFSVRWTSTQAVNGGVYRISVLSDDGVRVFVDGAPVINEWHSASGVPYLAAVNLTPGQHNFVVEFYEAGGEAFLTYAFDQTSGMGQPNPNTGATVTIIPSRLNVRNQPNANQGTVLTRVFRGETYPIVGRNADSTWYQINVNGTYGWVFALLVNATNIGNVPVTDASNRQTATTGFNVTADATVNIRSQPSIESAIFGPFRRGDVAQLVGRSRDGGWYQISYNGIVGWVSSRFVTPQPGTDFSRVPVTG